MKQNGAATPADASFLALAEALSALDGVTAVGQSGGYAPPSAVSGDIDIFVFCSAVPSSAMRRAAYESYSYVQAVNDHDGVWGVCDFMEIGATEVCALYFTMERMSQELEAVLHAERLDKEDNYFYPTGRCATMLGMHIFADPSGYITAWQRRLAEYPETLAHALLARHLPRIDNPEDFDRAVFRGDIFFYHATLDAALDHFLQALYALNHRYFPSRKRTEENLSTFTRLPADCVARLRETLQAGAQPRTLAHSYALWRALCADLRVLAAENG